MNVLELYQLTPPVTAETLAMYQHYFDAREMLMSDPQAALRLCQQGFQLATALGTSAGEAWYHREIGNVYHETGRTDDARQHLERAIALFDGLEIDVGLGSASNILGHIESSCAQHAKAITLFSKYIEIARKLGRVESEGLGLCNLAGVYLDLGNPWRALELLRAGLQRLETLPDEQLNIAWAGSKLGDVYRFLGQTETALMYLDDALQLQRSIGDDRYAAMTLRSKGACLLAEQRYDAALEVLFEAQTLAKRTGDALMHAGVLNLLAQVRVGQGQPVNARQVAQHALKHATSSDDRLEMMYARVLIARCELSITGNASALNELEVTLNEAKVTGSGAIEVFALTHLIRALRDHGRLHEALSRTEELREVERQLSKADTERLVTVMNAQLSAERDRYDLGIVRARAEALEAVNANLERLNAEKAVLLEQVRAQAEVLERLAHEDPLTGVFNRRHLDIELERAWSLAERRSEELCVAMIDLDHFKDINDLHTHAVGDEVLRAIAGIFKSKLRLEDTICRYGGEEFVVLLPGINLQDAVILLERLREAVQAHDWSAISVTEGVTISAGVASSRDAGHAKALVAQADEAQYSAKRDGRNRIASHAEI